MPAQSRSWFSADTSSGRRRRIKTIVSVVALTFSLVALTVRAQPVSSIPRLFVAVGATFVPLIALLGLVLALLSRRVLLAIAGVFLLTATLAIQVTWYYRGHVRDVGPYAEVRLLSSNILKGQADARSFVDIANSGADVIAVAELTPEAVTRFQEAGIDGSFPYSLKTPAPGAAGIGMWSRYPIKPATVARHRNLRMPAARVQVPGVAYPPVVASIHVMSPVAGDENTVDDWRNGMAGAKAQLDNFAREAGPGAVIIGGDYNSTPDMRQFRDLLTNGYRDAVEETGAGFAPTFRADVPIPPVITIDHILTRNAAVSSIKTITLKGSDHRSLLATIRVPVQPAD